MRAVWTGLLGALVAATFYAESAPDGYFFLLLGVAVAWLLVLTVWLVSIGARALVRRSLFALGPPDFVVPALVPLVGALLYIHVPLHVHYRLSRPAMNSAAKRVVAHPEEARSIRRIGLWPTSRVEKIPGGMRFLVSGSGFLDATGFAYSPKGEPASVGGEDAYEHLDGPWYVWRESW
ncbi:MAG TPA: hypothetical protein VE596_12480 [Gaiellaceae bacterium]|nr:hypothetical protein [Gaiellaceae bacterium]